MKPLLFFCLFCAGVIVVLTALRQFYIDPFSTLNGNIAWFLIQLLPLLVPLPAAIGGNFRSVFVLCLVSLLYFVHGVVTAFDPGMRWFAGGEIFFSLALCGSSALYVRRARELEAQTSA